MSGLLSSPPRGLYYGWVVVGSLAITETVSWGVLYYAFSALLLPMQRDLGWSTAHLTGAYSLALLISGVAAVPVGRWLDRHGPRALMTAGSIVAVLLVLAWSRVDTLPAYYLVWAGIGLAMAATLYEPAFTVATAWFERDRGKAMLLITFVAGFASTIFLPLSGWLADELGWRGALGVLAVILAALTVPPHALLLRRRPEDLGLRPDGERVQDGASATHHEVAAMPLRAALRDNSFWWLASAFFLATLASIAVAVHLIPFLVAEGYGAGFAATATGTIGAAQVLARVLVTLGGDRLPLTRVTAGVFALQAVALLLLLYFKHPMGVFASVLLLGAGRGAATLMRAALVAELWGRAHYGAIGGTLALVLTVAHALAPVGAGVAYGVLGSYDPVFQGLAAASILASLVMLGVGGSNGTRGSLSGAHIEAEVISPEQCQP